MKFELPEINWQDKNWTIPGQIKKILEEAGEVAEAIALADPVNTIREALDTMQTCATLISMVQAEWNAPLDKFLLEHESKLVRKGYSAKTKGDADRGMAYLTEETLKQKIKLIDELSALKEENKLLKCQAAALRDVLDEIYPMIGGRVIQLQKAGEEKAMEQWNDAAKKIFKVIDSTDPGADVRERMAKLEKQVENREQLIDALLTYDTFAANYMKMEDQSALDELLSKRDAISKLMDEMADLEGVSCK